MFPFSYTQRGLLLSFKLQSTLLSSSHQSFEIRRNKRPSSQPATNHSRLFKQSRHGFSGHSATHPFSALNEQSQAYPVLHQRWRAIPVSEQVSQDGSPTTKGASQEEASYRGEKATWINLHHGCQSGPDLPIFKSSHRRPWPRFREESPGRA